ncbi:long-chain fatty acid--CoA ligase [Thiospirochaeta perfilievii]|uniref:Long-chain fatty acid--CoA ligase n=1 Tax=Thiospirochaeta perfilievii TaxID=252967 RepID=A0A5C1QEW9_9SPIO|nr:AMP-binding protein [Thiospirochaeta perfilievii]QEN05559.1 long-chain fatty acid--CoA ligase [Thiospirochaeta perfilievii]
MSNTISQILKDYATKYKDYPLQYIKNKQGEFEEVSYSEFYNKTLVLATALTGLNVVKGSKVGVISENRGEWLLIDQALAALRAANVPRGVDVTKGELEYILNFAECETVFVENKNQLDKTIEVIDKLPNVKNIIIIEGDKIQIPGKSLYTFDELYNLGLGKDSSFVEKSIDSGEKDDLATIIFTSGTTGDPKGVMLSQYNFVHQTKQIDSKIHLTPGKDIWLTVLPVWHSYERAIQYIALASGSALAYSKPIGSVMLKDFETLNPTWLASVPRIWDALKTGIYKKVNTGSKVSKSLFHFFTKVCIYHRHKTDTLLGLNPRFTHSSKLIDKLFAIPAWVVFAPLNALGKVLVLNKIKSKFGNRFVAGISGGGSLPAHVEEFFSAAGILLLEGYGLTESAPIIGLKHQDKPVRGTIGTPFGCEFQIRDEEGNILTPGHKGVLYVRGEQVMLGYLKRDDLTKIAIDKDGWLNTGDIAIESLDGEFRIVGREKDTIVLLGGENLEPGPIERKLGESMYIQTPVIVGQDKKYLSALIVVDIDTIKSFANDNNISYSDEEALCELPEIREMINDEINRLVSVENGFKTFERIYKFKLLTKPFEVGKELSGKQDLKRHAIDEIYRDEIDELFK